MSFKHSLFLISNPDPEGIWPREPDPGVVNTLHLHRFLSALYPHTYAYILVLSPQVELLGLSETCKLAPFQNCTIWAV